MYRHCFSHACILLYSFCCAFNTEYVAKEGENLRADIDGIRDGDYVECFTDSEQTGIYIDYYMPVLIVPGVLTLLFLLIFVLLCMELFKKTRENNWHILVESEGENIDEKELGIFYPIRSFCFSCSFHRPLVHGAFFICKG